MIQGLEFTLDLFQPELAYEFFVFLPREGFRELVCHHLVGGLPLKVKGPLISLLAKLMIVYVNMPKLGDQFDHFREYEAYRLTIIAIEIQCAIKLKADTLIQPSICYNLFSSLKESQQLCLY